MHTPILSFLCLLKMSGVISSRVSNLKFMQRAIQKNEQKARAEAIDDRLPEEAHNEVGIYIKVLHQLEGLDIDMYLNNFRNVGLLPDMVEKKVVLFF